MPRFLKRILFIIGGLIISLLLLGIFGYFTITSHWAWNLQTEKALKPGDCTTVIGPKFGNQYDGELIDSHYHIPDLAPPILGWLPIKPDEPVLSMSLTIPDIACTLKQEKTKKVFAFFPVYRPFEKQMIELAKRTMERYPKTFVPFIMPPDDDGSPQGSPTVNASTLKDMLSVYPSLFKGYGEIGLYERKGGAPALPPNSARLRKIYPVVRKNKLMVYFHLGDGQQKSFEKALSKNPDINFIFHGDQLLPTIDGKVETKFIEQILSRHKNAYYTIDELYGGVWMIKPEKTKKDFLNHLKNYKQLLKEDLKLYKGFIERHPDQVLWGTDRSPEVLWSHDPTVGQALANYGRAFIAQLDPKVQEKFAYKNAEHLLADK